MKRLYFSIIALIAIIGFVAIACNDGNGAETDPCADGHTFPNWTAPTCTVDGNSERTCTKCTQTETRTEGYAKLGHDFSTGEDENWVETTAATLTTAGLETKTCKSCGETDGTRAIPKTGGTLTITNFLNGANPLQPGKYISGQVTILGPPHTILVFSASIPGMGDGEGDSETVPAVITGAAIPSSGSITLDVYQAMGNYPAYTFELFTESITSDRSNQFGLYMTESPELRIQKGPVYGETTIRDYYRKSSADRSVTFSNGNMTIDFEDIIQQ